MAKIQKTDNNNFWKGYGTAGILIRYLEEYMKTTLENIWQYTCLKLNMCLLYESTIPLLGASPRGKVHEYVYKKDVQVYP